MFKFSQKGVSLYLALMIMGVLLAIALGMSTIFIGQTKMLKEMGNSVIAFYAADAGIEKSLTQRNDPTPLDGYSETLDNGADYNLNVLGSTDSDCDAANYCIKSIGSYKGTKRAIEVMY